MPETMAPAREVEWVYQGVRISVKNHLLHTWLNEQGELVAFTKLRGGAVGGHYRVRLSPDGSPYYTGASAPTYLRPAVDREMALRLELEDRAARTKLEADRRSKNADSQLDAALAPIRAKYKSTIGSANRAALLALVIQRITG